MIVEKVVVGLYQENCYFLIKEDKMLIVDPGDEYSIIKNKINELNKEVVGVLITHAHFDHVGALEELLNDYKVPVYYNNCNNEIKYNNIIDVKEKEYNINCFNFEIVYTKGHRNDCVTYYFNQDKIMITGDFLFKLSIGRMDLEYASEEEMIKSLNKIVNYNDDITIYPGHGDSSTLGYEKLYNPYLKGISV